MEQSSVYGTNSVAEAVTTVPAVERALDVLELLAGAADRPTLTEIAARLGLPKGSTHRLLGTLTARGYVSAGEGRSAGYALGPRLYALTAQGRRRPTDLADAAREPLERLAATTGEGCQLSVRSGDRAVVLLRVASPSHPEVALMGGAGASFPLHAVAVGKALLAFAPEAERTRYLTGALDAFTPATVTDSARLAAELDAIRAAGLARDEQEYKRGLRAFAAPVFGPDGTCVAAVALPLLVGAYAEGDSSAEERFVAALRESATAISRNLGG